jgi:hypothetical protein
VSTPLSLASALSELTFPNIGGLTSCAQPHPMKLVRQMTECISEDTLEAEEGRRCGCGLWGGCHYRDISQTECTTIERLLGAPPSSPQPTFASETEPVKLSLAIATLLLQAAPRTYSPIPQDHPLLSYTI